VTADAKRSSLWPRILAAAVLVPAALAAVYVGGWTLALWVTAAGIAMALEWTAIVHRERIGWRLGLHVVALAASQALLALGRADWAFASILVAALIGNLAAQGREERGVWVVLGIVYIAVPCLALVWLRQHSPYGFETVIWLFLVVWATDSAAYVAGTVIGGPKLAPAISPSKTWVGAIAGLAAGIAATIAFAQWIGSGADPKFAALGALLSLLTQCGDLAESVLKRSFGVKDASDLIPGHGGALDRLDGMIFATLGLAAYVAVAETSPLAWIIP
jgi:phosphatidate cytidylyltransferase